MGIKKALIQGLLSKINKLFTRDHDLRDQHDPQ